MFWREKVNFGLPIPSLVCVLMSGEQERAIERACSPQARDRYQRESLSGKAVCFFHHSLAIEQERE